MLYRQLDRRLIVGTALATMGFLRPATVWGLCEYFNFRLSPDQVVPFAEAEGSGWSELQLCEDDSLRGYIIINVAETVTAVHIHGPAEAGQNGDVLYELPLPSEQGLGVLLGPVSEEQREWLVTYQTYVDVHTVEHPEGAVRGQMLNQGDAIERTPWDAVKRLFR